MKIESFKGLIEWTQASHTAMAKCLASCASENPDERASLVLTYLAAHEAKLEKMVAQYARGDSEAGGRELPDNVAAAGPVQCNGRFAKLSADQITEQVFEYHADIIKFYDDMIAKVKNRRTVEKMTEMRDMELKESKLLVRQTGRMQDV